MFADFDADHNRRVFAVRISFDGYGCCRAPATIGRMSGPDSETLLAMVEGSAIDSRAEEMLRSYFRLHRDALWSDALEHHDLL